MLKLRHMARGSAGQLAMPRLGCAAGNSRSMSARSRSFRESKPGGSTADAENETPKASSTVGNGNGYAFPGPRLTKGSGERRELPHASAHWDRAPPENQFGSFLASQNTFGQARRELQWGPGNHSRGALNGVMYHLLPRKFLNSASENGAFWSTFHIPCKLTVFYCRTLNPSAAPPSLFRPN